MTKAAQPMIEAQHYLPHPPILQALFPKTQSLQYCIVSLIENPHVNTIDALVGKWRNGIGIGDFFRTRRLANNIHCWRLLFLGSYNDT